jgi:putative cell wall-binding protein
MIGFPSYNGTKINMCSFWKSTNAFSLASKNSLIVTYLTSTVISLVLKKLNLNETGVFSRVIYRIIYSTVFFTSSEIDNSSLKIHSMSF